MGRHRPPASLRQTISDTLTRDVIALSLRLGFATPRSTTTRCISMTTCEAMVEFHNSLIWLRLIWLDSDSGATPTGPRKVRPDDKLRIEPGIPMTGS